MISVLIVDLGDPLVVLQFCDVCVGAVGAGPCGMLSSGPEG